MYVRAGISACVLTNTSVAEVGVDSFIHSGLTFCLKQEKKTNCFLSSYNFS